MQGLSTMHVNEKTQVLKEYANAKANGELERARIIQLANGKWISRDEFANATP